MTSSRLGVVLDQSEERCRRRRRQDSRRQKTKRGCLRPPDIPLTGLQETSGVSDTVAASPGPTMQFRRAGRPRFGTPVGDIARRLAGSAVTNTDAPNTDRVLPSHCRHPAEICPCLATSALPTRSKSHQRPGRRFCIVSPCTVASRSRRRYSTATLSMPGNIHPATRAATRPPTMTCCAADGIQPARRPRRTGHRCLCRR